LAKYRKVQQSLEQAEERAETAENALAKMRTTSRNSVSASRVIISNVQRRIDPASFIFHLHITTSLFV